MNDPFFVIDLKDPKRQHSFESRPNPTYQPVITRHADGSMIILTTPAGNPVVVPPPARVRALEEAMKEIQRLSSTYTTRNASDTLEKIRRLTEKVLD